MGRPYAVEEIISFDRMRRAVMARVVDAAEEALQRGQPLDKQKLSDLTAQEWKAAKDAVRSSPAAREKARELMERIVGDIVDGLIQQDREELEALGVQEKFL